MQDEEFYDLLYQLWTKTTGAGNSFWKYEEEWPGIISTVHEDGWEDQIAYGMQDNDLEWVTAVHGCFGDLIRKLKDLEDENARLDEKHDQAQADILDLVKENQSLTDELGMIYDRLDRV